MVSVVHLKERLVPSARAVEGTRSK
jgi:hypothetical protein